MTWCKTKKKYHYQTTNITVSNNCLFQKEIINKQQEISSLICFVKEIQGFLGKDDEILITINC